MNNKVYILLPIVVIILILAGCGRKHETIEINVSNSIKEAIEESAPVDEYCFYVLKDSYPKSFEDMSKAKLFVCGKVGNQTDLRVMMASLNDHNSLLFKSIRRYFINPNILSGQLATSEDVSITLNNGEVIKIPRDNSIYGNDTSIDTLIHKCSEEMKKNNNSVLLIGRSVDSAVLNQMVEIIFK